MAIARNAASLADLPEPALALAYVHLPREDRCSLVRTCKTIREAVLHLVSGLMLHTLSPTSTAEALDALAHYPRGAVLRRLSIINSSSGRSTGHWLPLLRAICQDRTKLGDRLARVDSVMLKGCSTSSVADSHELGATIFPSLFPDLQSLTLACCSCDDTSLLDNLDSRQLQALSLSIFTSFNTPAPAVPLLISRLSRLEHLSLHLPIQPDATPNLAPLAACTRLRTLELDWPVSQPHPRGLPSLIRGCPKLQDLSLTTLTPLLDPSAASASLKQIHATCIQLGHITSALSVAAFHTRFPQLQRIAVHCLVLAPPDCPQSSAECSHGEGMLIEPLMRQSACVLAALPIALESMSLSLVGPGSCLDGDVSDELRGKKESESVAALKALAPLSGTPLTSGLRRLMIDCAYITTEAVHALAAVFPHVSVLVWARNVAVADTSSMKAAIMSWRLTAAVFPLPYGAGHDDVMSVCEEAQCRSAAGPLKLCFGFKSRQHVIQFDPKGCEARWCEAHPSLPGRCKVHLAFL